MRVLIAEDDIINRTLLEKVVEPYGEIVSVGDGRTVVEVFQKALSEGAPFDLVFMDIMMPEASGHQALENIRAVERKAGVPDDRAVKVIMVSALSDQRSITRSFFKGQAMSYVTKPVDVDKLRGELARFGLIEGNGRSAKAAS